MIPLQAPETADFLIVDRDLTVKIGRVVQVVFDCHAIPPHIKAAIAAMLATIPPSPPVLEQANLGNATGGDSRDGLQATPAR